MYFINRKFVTKYLENPIAAEANNSKQQQQFSSISF